MGRTGGTSRALQIVSRALGWNPDEIIGEAYQSPEVFKSDTGPIPESMNSVAHMDNPGSDGADWTAPDRGRHKTPKGSNPFPGMPGAKG